MAKSWRRRSRYTAKKFRPYTLATREAPSLAGAHPLNGWHWMAAPPLPLLVQLPPGSGIGRFPWIE
jgi:hypothetical protein